MESFSFTLTQGVGVSYSVHTPISLTGKTITVQMKKGRTDPWATTTLIEAVIESANTLRINIAGANSTSTVAPSYYQVLADGTLILDGRIFMATPREGTASVFTKNVKNIIASTLVAGQNTAVNVNSTTGDVVIESSGASNIHIGPTAPTNPAVDTIWFETPA